MWLWLDYMSMPQVCRLVPAVLAAACQPSARIGDLQLEESSHACCMHGAQVNLGSFAEGAQPVSHSSTFPSPKETEEEVPGHNLEADVTVHNLEAETEEESKEASKARRLSADHRHTGSELAAAVNSIPSYVERSSLLLVVAPSARHGNLLEQSDFQSWRRRGWCRMEFTAAMLAQEELRILLVRGGSDTPCFVNPMDCQGLMCGEGEFTCCARNHTTGPCDKHKVRSVMETMIASKIQHFKDIGDVLEYRWFVMLKPALMKGLPVAEGVGEETQRPASSSSALQRLKTKLAWRDDATESAYTATSGVSLLHWACLGNELEAVKELLQQNPHLNNSKHINMRTKIPFPNRGVSAGYTPLELGAGFGSSELMNFMLEAGANSTSADRCRLIMCASIWSNQDAVRATLQKAHSTAAQRLSMEKRINKATSLGMTPLSFACFRSNGPAQLGALMLARS